MENNNPKKAEIKVIVNEYNHLQLIFRYNGLPLNELTLNNDFYTTHINIWSNRTNLKGTLMLPTKLMNNVIKTEKLFKYGAFEVKREGNYLEIYFTVLVSIKKAVKVNEGYAFNIKIENTKNTNLVYTVPTVLYEKLLREYKNAQELTNHKNNDLNNKRKQVNNNKTAQELINHKNNDLNNKRKQVNNNKTVPKSNIKNMRICSNCYYYRTPRFCRLLNKQPYKGEARNCSHFNTFKGVERVFNGGGFSPR